jgi:hypothetical protein
VEEHRERDRLCVESIDHLPEDGLGIRPGPEQRGANRRLVGDDLVAQALVLGELLDELEHARHVGGRGAADAELGHGADLIGPGVG